jgi:hypothetical protein
VIQTDAVARDAGDNGRHNPLLRLPAVGDNAAMESEPPTAEPPKRRRRWFQFSLRSLMIFTVVCEIPFGWFGARMRRAERQKEFGIAFTLGFAVP